MPKNKVTVLKSTRPHGLHKELVWSFFKKTNRTFQHVMQRDMTLSRIDFNPIVESQFEVAKYLEKNGNAAVIVENVDGRNESEPRYKDGIADNKIIFPNGLPNSFSELNILQKAYLYLHEGVGYAFYSRRIEQTYSDDLTYESNRKEIIAQTTSQYVKVDQIKKYFSLSQAQKIANETGKEVLLVYGKVQIFEDVAKCFPDLDLSYEDLSMPLTYIDVEVEERLLRARLGLQVNCHSLAKGFVKPIAIPAPTKVEASSFNTAVIVTGLLGLGLLAYGLFKCCRSRRRNPVQNTAGVEHAPRRGQA